MTDKGLKRAIIIGAVLGALTSLGTALSLDVLIAGTFQGGWRDAAARDVAKLFGPACGGNWFAVTLMLVLVMGFLAAFGAVLGIVAGVIMNRFFRALLK